MGEWQIVRQIEKLTDGGGTDRTTGEQTDGQTEASILRKTDIQMGRYNIAIDGQTNRDGWMVGRTD